MRSHRLLLVVLACALCAGSAAARENPARFVPDPAAAEQGRLDDRTWVGAGGSWEVRVTLLSDEERHEYLKRLTGFDVDPFATPPGASSGYHTFHFQISNFGKAAIPFRPQAVWIVTPRATVEHPVGMEALGSRYREIDQDLPAAYEAVGRAFLEAESSVDPGQTLAGLMVYREVGPRIGKFHLEVPLTLPSGDVVRLQFPYAREKPVEGNEARGAMTTETGAPRILDGTATARAMREDVATRTAALTEATGIIPGLAVVLVGDDPASAIYVRNKQRAAEEAGMRSSLERLPADAGEQRVLDVVARLNADPAVHGILVQLPLPKGISTERVIQTIDPAKDVDGLHPINAGRLATGLPGFVPCTPAGIVRMLDRYEIPLEGKRAVVIGRSNIVGKPMAFLLLNRNCTVTMCHSRTADLAAIASTADILVAAVGKPALVTAEFVKSGAAVVDVGIHRVENEADCRRYFGDDPKRLAAVREKGSTLVGDVHPLDVRGRAGWLTPVPGGVGPLTIAQLLSNTLDAAESAAGR